MQVKTQLQYPTKYHVRQSQKRQVQHFLNEHHNDHNPIQSLPNNVVTVSSFGQQQTQHQLPQYVQTSTSAPDPDLSSPLLHGTGANDVSIIFLLSVV